MASNELILVTGVSGYVGKWCAVKLLEKGYRVRGTVRSKSKAQQVNDTIGRLLGAEAAARLDLVEDRRVDSHGLILVTGAPVYVG